MTPARLYPIKENNNLDKIEDWVNKHPNFCLMILFAVLMILLIALAYAVVGLSATDSGSYFNHLKDVI